MQSILDATAALLDEKSFTEISINDIVGRAGCSVGAFYGRFQDKDALLQALDEEYFHDMLVSVQAAVLDANLAAVDLPEVIRRLVQALYEVLARRRGLMRTLILAARTQPDPRFRLRENQVMQAFPQLLAVLLARREHIHHPDAELAVQFGFFHTWYAMQDMVLWEHLAARIPVQGNELVEELSRAYLAYLCYGG
jgi:AcrR family transcriptional regulator